jgi:hypothetical protein
MLIVSAQHDALRFAFMIDSTQKNQPLLLEFCEEAFRPGCGFPALCLGNGARHGACRVQLRVTP